MKKLSAVLLAASMLPAFNVYAESSEAELLSSVNSALSWIEINAAPTSYPGTVASDYYIMAQSRLGAGYEFRPYVKLIESIVPDTKQDGQRLIMTSTACGERLTDSFVGLYTYDDDLKSAADLAGAVITLQSGGYKIKSDTTDINRMVGTLLTYQQQDGSFGNDVLATAKSVIALSDFRNAQYELHGTKSDEVYTYTTESAIDNAVNYLASKMRDDGSFATIINTAYVITALDSIGIDCENYTKFDYNGNTPLSYLMKAQSENGSFSGSADDTAIAACAMLSHLRLLQNKSKFFDFTSDDKVDIAAAQHNTQKTDSAITSAAGSATAKPQPAIVTIAPQPTKAPEHSEKQEEEYGPYPFVGPMQQKKTDKAEKNAVPEETDETTQHSGTAGLAVLLVILLLFGGALVFIKFKKPELYNRIIETAKSIIPDKGNAHDKEPDETAPSAVSNSIFNEMTSSSKVVSEEELYNPDFIKTLIPVDEINSSIESLVENDSTTTEDNEKL